MLIRSLRISPINAYTPSHLNVYIHSPAVNTLHLSMSVNSHSVSVFCVCVGVV